MSRKYWGVIILLLLVAMSFLGSVLTLWVDWLWFNELGYPVLFTRSLWSQLQLGVVCGGLFFAVVYINSLLARRLARKQKHVYYDSVLEFPQLEGLKRFIHLILVGIAVFLAYVVGSWASGGWELYLRFQNAIPFQILDPLFSKDIGFYFFQIPFYLFLYRLVLVTLVLIFLISLLVYLVEGGFWLTRRGPQIAISARIHLSSVVAAILVLFSLKYRLDIFDMLYSTRGVVYGASYTDIKAEIPALWVLVYLSLLAAILVLYSGFRQSFKWALVGIGLLVAASILGTGVYPEIVQRFEVAPNEIRNESPYINLGIKYTRMAYGIDKVQEEEFPALENLNLEILKKNELTMQNIRLWDHRPLLRTYEQLQVIRPYYDFVDVDNDRYVIDGKYRQVSLSPREISSSKLPSRIWINEHLTYTHGYGVCLGPVNQTSSEGLPQFMIKDIPPASTTNIKITRPEIYFGEITDSYCFVRTHSKEFDYPSGDENVYTEYRGQGGIPVKSFFRKLLFSLRFWEPKILLSGDIYSDSRLMFDRTITRRLNKLLPFLRFDQDAYMVISDSGELYWMVDAYTYGEEFPYSQPVPKLGNYVRNSVKCVIDAYNGTVQFYISDPTDPLIQVYARIFPGVFKTMDSMPKDLRQHIRYPEDLFTLQASIYATYHMTDPQVYYNKEDLWKLPALSLVNGERVVEPYYTIMKLNTEGAVEEFILMTPFTPSNRENMIAWMAARCDGENYGKLIVYNFPKQRLVYGPTQIVSRFNQDTQISQQLSLWNQRGSSVINGSLLVIPVEDSILYIQPLYLAAEQAGGLPELKRIIVAYANKIAMEETLELSLARIFGGAVSRADVPSTAQPSLPRESSNLKSLVEQAGEHYRKAQEALKNADWSGYGEEIRKLGESIKAMEERSR